MLCVVVCLVGFFHPGLAVHIHTNAPCICTSLSAQICMSQL